MTHDPPAGAHGGDGAQLARALGIAPAEVLDLSASLNPLAPPIAPLAARHLDALDRYPDVGEATSALAGTLGVDEDRLLLVNGGAEAIALVAAELGEGRIDEPDFSLYRRHLQSVRADAPRWRSNPNNPTGRLAGPHEQAAVWDEAFYPLATGRWTSGEADRGAVVLGSLTKTFACPGLRIGFVLGAPELMARLANRQPRWAVSGLAAAMIPELLATANLPFWAADIARLRSELAKALADFGLEAMPSDANYVLVPHAAGLRARLARHRVLVRDCSSFGLADHVRIAVPSEDGLARVRDALEATE